MKWPQGCDRLDVVEGVSVAEAHTYRSRPVPVKEGLTPESVGLNSPAVVVFCTDAYVYRGFNAWKRRLVVRISQPGQGLAAR